MHPKSNAASFNVNARFRSVCCMIRREVGVYGVLGGKNLIKMKNNY